MRNNYHLAAGIIYLFSAVLHLIGGQLALVNPLLDSELDLQVRTEWLGAWHIITVMLFYFGYILLKNGLRYQTKDESLIKAIGVLSALFCLSFLGAGLWLQCHAPQYILFAPVVILIYFGFKNQKTRA